MNDKERYIKNRTRVYDIYDVPEDKRSNSWNCHHIQNRSNGGSHEKSNLFPTPKKLHRMLHRTGVDNGVLHDFIEMEYGEDPYQ